MDDQSLDGSWCEISLPQIASNLTRVLRRLTQGTRLCAVVKADAYGHGIENVVPLLIAQGITHIGISSNSEARAVRDVGFEGSILRLRTAAPQEVEIAMDYRVEEMVGTVEGLQSLVEILGEEALPKLHISLNANGMSRDGLELSTVSGREACAEILDLAARHVVGLCTHFPSNDPKDLTDSSARFQDDLSLIFANSSLRREDVIVHGGSTLTLASEQDPNTDMMRCGAILYGIAGPRPEFQPTLTLKSRVTSVGDYPKGSTIGYDRTACLSHDGVLASISLGYANGYCRQLAGRGEVLIRGHRLPVMGKISMNTIVVDVTTLPDVTIGDEVVAFGRQGDERIGDREIERLSGTIMADLFSDWGQRNPRVIC